jgi:hypothetical protein
METLSVYEDVNVFNWSINPRRHRVAEMKVKTKFDELET